MYEVETKVEITAEERDQLISLFKEKGFGFEGMIPQKDIYYESVKSPHGGFDLKRYRQEGDSYFHTQKAWEEVEGTLARKEDEHGVTKEEFEAETAKYPDAIKIMKERETYVGNYKEQEIILCIDSVKFDHSPSVRLFIESEVLVNDKAKVKEAQALGASFLAELLGRNDFPLDQPGMFTMAFKKL